MASRIHLVRHGVSAHVHDGSWVDARGAARFMELYDAAGIRDEPPPAEAIEAAAGAHVLAASTLPRAMESLERLAPGREAEFTPLLCELPFSSPRRGIRLPVLLWDSIGHAYWTWSIMRRSPIPEMMRARAATEWLVERATGDRTILAVTHGAVRRFILASLIDRGWKPEFSRKTYHNWSVWTFRSP